jgi:hypothetical protein
MAFALAGTMGLCAGLARAQNGKLAAAAPVSYDNKYELYGGFNFMNTQAGQSIPYRANLGGMEFLATRWLTGHLGVAGDFRAEAGTTPVDASPISQSGVSRPLIYEFWGMGGVQYRGPKNHYAALDYHALGGVAHGVFDTQTAALPYSVGLYSNRTSPMFALGASVDFNRSKNWAIRMSPDLILEHWGTETREFFAISGGVVYRIGKR